MAGPEPERLTIPRGERRALKRLVRRHRAPHAVVQRARIVLMAARGFGTETIARRLSCSSRYVRKWKARFSAAPCLSSLDDATRSGRPSRIPVAVRCQLVQLACARPDDEEDPPPFRDVWTYASLAQVLGERTGHFISVSEVGR